MFLRITFLSLLLVPIVACQQTSGIQSANIAAQAQPIETPPTTRPIPTDTLYSLLKAEFAGQRKLPAVTLNEYRQLAPETRDLDVVKRATLIAQYLNADQDILAHAQLWSELEPQNIEAQTLVVAQLIKQNKLDEAFERSVKLMNLGMTSPFQAVALQAARQDRVTQQQLLDQFRQALQQHPDNSDLLTGEALLLLAIGDTERSLASTEQAIKADNKNTAAYVLKASLFEKLGEQKKAADILRKQVRKAPDNQRLRLQYARVLTEVNLKEAQKQFYILQQANPFDPDLLLSLALVSKELEEWKVAKEYFEQLLFLKKHTSSAYYYLGQISTAQGDETRALELYRRVTDGEEYLYAAAAVCQIYIQQQQTNLCQDYMHLERERLKSISSPDTALALTVRLYLIEADLLHRKLALVEELTILNEALEQFPQHEDLLYARSMVYELAGNLKAAEDDLRTILNREPDNANALNALGYTLVNKTDRTQEGYEMITRALALDPNNAAINDSMGWALYRLNRSDEALEYLQRAMASYPNHEVAAHLGEVLWMIGQQNAARKIWNKGLEDDPDSAIILETQNRLQAH